MEETLSGEYIENFVAPWYELSTDDAAAIIDQMKEQFDMGTAILELVYEPYRENQSAFRVIVATEFADEVTQVLIDATRESMPQTNPDEDREWTFEDQVEYYRNYGKPRSRKAFRANADLVRTAALQYFGRDPPFDVVKADDSEDDCLDEIRYPSIIRAYPYRAVWKDMCLVDLPRYMHPLTICNLLGEADPWEDGADQFVDDFGHMVGCEVVSNMSSNVVYMGSESEERLECALRCLRTILINKIRAAPSDAHTVCAEVAKSYFTMTRGNHALKLFRSTFLVDQPVTYSELFNTGEHICLSPDQKIRRIYCPPVKGPIPLDERPPHPRTPWAEWEGYVYLPKQPVLAAEDLIQLTLEDKSSHPSTSGTGTALDGKQSLIDVGKLLSIHADHKGKIVADMTEPGVLPLFRLLHPMTWPSVLLEKIEKRLKSRDEFIEMLCASMKHLVRRLAQTNDKVSLHISFGRIVLHNTVEIARRNKALSHFNYDEDKLLGGLNTYFLSHGGGVLFTHVLTLFGSDIPKLLAQKNRAGLTMFSSHPFSRRVWYEFRFTDRVRADFDCIIAIDADSFAVEYRESVPDDGRLLVHFPQKPWDMVVSATRANAANVKAVFDRDHELGKCLLQTLTTRYDAKGKFTISAELPRHTTKILKNVKIRHVAKFGSQISGGAYLFVDMVDHMMVDRRAMPKFTTLPMPPGVHNGAPSRWFEVGIASTTADDMFARNASRADGDPSAWSPDEMEEAKVFMDMTQHAMNLMPAVAVAGCHNDNGLSAAWNLPAELPETDGFW